jgi:hypothetical protein
MSNTVFSSEDEDVEEDYYIRETTIELSTLFFLLEVTICCALISAFLVCTLCEKIKC